MVFPSGVRAGALALCGLAPAARADEKITAQYLIDRRLILDQITRYHPNFGKVDQQSEESFYAEDGELILGTRHDKGHESIKQAYNNRACRSPKKRPPMFSCLALTLL